jgi:hypothetical protein
VGLQILTGNEFKAQAHKTKLPNDPRIGRMSHVNYLSPPFATLLRPLDTEEIPMTGADLNLLTDYDRDVIPPCTLITNHWHPQQRWIDFYTPHMVQYVLNRFLKELPYKATVEQFLDKIQVQGNALQMHRYHFDQIDSTMNICAKLPDNYVTDKHCYAFIAKSQKSG